MVTAAPSALSCFYSPSSFWTQMPKTLWMLGDSNLLMVSTSLVKISSTSLRSQVKGRRAAEPRGFRLAYLGLACAWSAYLLMATWKPWYSPR